MLLLLFSHSYNIVIVYYKIVYFGIAFYIHLSFLKCLSQNETDATILCWQGKGNFGNLREHKAESITYSENTLRFHSDSTN